jgi:hypothetical protein
MNSNLSGNKEAIMVKSFSEIVIEGHFGLVKGFLMGFLYGSEKEFSYFFHRKSGIRRETLKDLLKELFEFENFVHLCIESSKVSKFIKAIENSNDKIGLQVQSVKKIKSAGFNFSYEVFNEEIAYEIKNLFLEDAKKVKLQNYKPVNIKDKEAIGIEGYAPEHHFIGRGSGQVKGNFLYVMELYLKIKRCKSSELIISNDIILQLEN